MDDQTVHQMAEAFRKVLSEGEGGGDGMNGENRRAILIKRIPIICNDILTIKNNLKWITWMLMGITGGIGYIALQVLTNK